MKDHTVTSFSPPTLQTVISRLKESPLTVLLHTLSYLTFTHTVINNDIQHIQDTTHPRQCHHCHTSQYYICIIYHETRFLHFQSKCEWSMWVADGIAMQLLRSYMGHCQGIIMLLLRHSELVLGCWVHEIMSGSIHLWIYICIFLQTLSHK